MIKYHKKHGLLIVYVAHLSEGRASTGAFRDMIVTRHDLFFRYEADIDLDQFPNICHTMIIL